MSSRPRGCQDSKNDRTGSSRSVIHFEKRAAGGRHGVLGDGARGDDGRAATRSVALHRRARVRASRLVRARVVVVVVVVVVDRRRRRRRGVRRVRGGDARLLRDVLLRDGADAPDAARARAGDIRVVPRPGRGRRRRGDAIAGRREARARRHRAPPPRALRRRRRRRRRVIASVVFRFVVILPGDDRARGHDTRDRRDVPRAVPGHDRRHALRPPRGGPVIRCVLYTGPHTTAFAW